MSRALDTVPSSRDIQALARRYVPKALKELARLAREAKSAAVRAEAAEELKVRGFGAETALTSTDNNNQSGVDHDAN